VNSGSPGDLTVFNNKLYFAASSAASGNELWVYDGTNPPSLAADIYAGASGSWVYDLTVFQDKLYFQATDGINGSELWSYDGASASLAQDIRPLASSGNPGGLTVLSNKLYFSANNGTDGYELWSYDGTNPAAMVEDIRPGANSSSPSELTVFEDRLYFTANDGTNGTELWVYDGTNATGFDMNQTGSGIEDFMGPNGQLVSTSMGMFFSARDGITGHELWRIAPAPVVVPTAKTNAGSFNGYVAVYAKGHKGKTLSWKIAGKWYKKKITSDYQVFQRKTAAVGLNVYVHLYIDGKKQLTKTVKTR